MLFDTFMDDINSIIRAGKDSGMSDLRFFEKEIQRWKESSTRANQIIGENYYRGKHDILKRRRTAIGQRGELEEVRNLPNNKIVNNQYAKMVDQKTNYLFGQPFAIQTENEKYSDALNAVFDKRFHRIFQNLGEDSINCGIGWLYVYYDEYGEFRFKRLPPYEIKPFWKDAEHTELDCVVRVYTAEVYEGEELRVVEKVEIYKSGGIERYVLINGVLVEDVENPSSSYLTFKDGNGGEDAYNWERIPIIPFKYNDEEIPLICKVKSLQDALNVTLSDFQNNMQEDSRNTILVIKNYDGENLADFRHNLSQYGAIKVKTFAFDKDTGGGVTFDGGVEALTVEVNSENYKVFVEMLKRALIENAMGYDAKDERMAGNPNQMNIQSMYSDIDLDANGMETEYQAAFEDLLFFVNAHLANVIGSDFVGEKVNIVFNRDMMMNEADIINNINASSSILSRQTLIANHPWIDDVEAEIRRLEDEEAKRAEQFGDVFLNHREDETKETDDEK